LAQFVCRILPVAVWNIPVKGIISISKSGAELSLYPAGN
jgi:hypothetical protein